MLVVQAFIWYMGRPERSFFWKEYLHSLWTLPVMLFLSYFYRPLAGPWHQKRHFEAINVPLVANEDVVLKLQTLCVASLEQRRFSGPS